MRRGIWAIMLFSAFFALASLWPRGSAAQASSKAKPQIPAETVKQAIEKKAGRVQVITFPNTGWSPVKVVRGSSSTRRETEQKPGDEKAEVAEIVTFADSQTRPVRIVRGEADRAAAMPGQPRRAYGMNLEVVAFADPRDRPVSILRGAVSHMLDTGLFGPASVVDLDRVAFAVDGAESSHGADLRMWRRGPSGPQGPMQVTAAAAVDVGGGDRFDFAENRALGRAYLARMYGRYGNWPDAVAAYNWGPGNVDTWISEGRRANKFPLEVERYRDRVLRDAVLSEPNTAMLSTGWPFRLAAPPLSASETPAPASTVAEAASLIDAVERITGTGDAAIREIIATLQARTANWRSAYLGVGDQISLLFKKRPRPSRELGSEYAVSAEPDD
jgi:Transglycosylase SLT domain